MARSGETQMVEGYEVHVTTGLYPHPEKFCFGLTLGDWHLGHGTSITFYDTHAEAMKRGVAAAKRRAKKGNDARLAALAAAR